MERNENIEHYFHLGLQQEEILDALKHLHNIQLSKRQLQRILKLLGLYRRKHFTALEDVQAKISQMLLGTAKCHGYRWFHLKLIQAGIVVPRETVRILLLFLDPRGVELRKQHRLQRRIHSDLPGPNFIWSIDSCDKIKPFGICVNGSLDVLTRFAIWLKACRNSSDPNIIAGFYYYAVKQLEGIPCRMRSDLGKALL